LPGSSLYSSRSALLVLNVWPEPFFFIFAFFAATERCQQTVTGIRDFYDTCTGKWAIENLSLSE
jgi:hypothetical protein